MVQFTVHQLVQRRTTAAIVLAAIAGVGYLAYTAYPNPLFGVVSIAILVFSISAFLFPIRYRLTNKGVYMRNFLGSERREWGKFYDYFIYNDAVLLSFDYRTLRGRIQKGILVYFDAKREYKDKLLEIIRSKITKPEKPVKAVQPAKSRFPWRRVSPGPSAAALPGTPTPDKPVAPEKPVAPDKPVAPEAGAGPVSPAGPEAPRAETGAAEATSGVGKLPESGERPAGPPAPDAGPK